MSLRNGLVCFGGLVGMTLLAIAFLVPLTNCVLRVCFSTLSSCLEIFSTNNNICNFGHNKFQQLSTFAFCSWDDLVTEKRNSGSPNNLRKCTESSPTLTPNISIEWNLYLSWSKHLAKPFRLEMIVGGFSKHQNKTSDTAIYNGYLFNRSCVSSQCEYYIKIFSAVVWIAGC